MIALAHHFDYWHYSTLLSRLPLNFSNPLKSRIIHPKNLQASCKHVASTLQACERIPKAMRITSDIRYEIRLLSIDRDLLAAERGGNGSIRRGSE